VWRQGNGRKAAPVRLRHGQRAGIRAGPVPAFFELANSVEGGIGAGAWAVHESHAGDSAREERARRGVLPRCLVAVAAPSIRAYLARTRHGPPTRHRASRGALHGLTSDGVQVGLGGMCAPEAAPADTRGVPWRARALAPVLSGAPRIHGAGFVLTAALSGHALAARVAGVLEAAARLEPGRNSVVVHAEDLAARDRTGHRQKGRRNAGRHADKRPMLRRHAVPTVGNTGAADQPSRSTRIRARLVTRSARGFGMCPPEGISRKGLRETGRSSAPSRAGQRDGRRANSWSEPRNLVYDACGPPLRTMKNLR
jgi:hypothetical protein